MKLRNYIHFITDVKLWPHLMRITIRKIKRIISNDYKEYETKIKHSKEISNNWCKEKSINIQALKLKLGIKEDSSPFEVKFKNEILQAEERIKKCPFKMGGAGNLNLIYLLLDHIKAKKIIETGVAYGWSSLTTLIHLNNLSDSMTHLWSVDMPYVGMNNKKWVGCAVDEKYKTNWTLFQMADRDGIPKAIKAARDYDFAHYDSDKTLEGRKFGYSLLWKHLKKGGILLSDDINDNEGFKIFSESINKSPIIIEDKGKYQGLLIK